MGWFYSRPFRSVWIHLVLNFMGPNHGEGIQIYYNGAQVASDRTKSSGSRPSGDGRIVVGRYYPDFELYYASVQVDELIFFNRYLIREEISVLAT